MTDMSSVLVAVSCSIESWFIPGIMVHPGVEDPESWIASRVCLDVRCPGSWKVDLRSYGDEGNVEVGYRLDHM
jgi:hypothetical protein